MKINQIRSYLKSFNFLRRCEYVPRKKDLIKTSKKNLKYFSSRLVRSPLFRDTLYNMHIGTSKKVYCCSLFTQFMFIFDKKKKKKKKL